MNRLLLIIISILVVTACDKNNHTALAPKAEFITEEGYIWNDTTLEFGVSYKVGVLALGEDANITNFIVRVDNGEESTYLDSGMNTRVLDYSKTLVKGPSAHEKWTFIIRDRNGLYTELSNTISLDTTTINYGDVDEYSNIVLGAQNNLQNGFLSLSNGISFSLEDGFNNQDVIDMCYYYDIVDTDENTISSPGGNISDLIYTGEYWPGNWQIRRETRYKTTEFGLEDFAGIQNDSLLIVAYGSTEGKRKAKNLTAGDIFSFKNQDGLIGMFYVHSVTGMDEGQIEISIKLQKK